MASPPPNVDPPLDVKPVIVEDIKPIIKPEPAEADAPLAPPAKREREDEDDGIEILDAAPPKRVKPRALPVIKAYIHEGSRHAVRVSGSGVGVYIVADYVLQAGSEVLRQQLEGQRNSRYKVLALDMDHSTLAPLLYLLNFHEIDISKDVAITVAMREGLVPGELAVLTPADVELRARCNRLITLFRSSYTLRCASHFAARFRDRFTAILRDLSFSDFFTVLAFANERRWLDLAREVIRAIGYSADPQAYSVAEIDRGLCAQLGPAGWRAYEAAVSAAEARPGQADLWDEAAMQYQLPMEQGARD